MLVKVVSMKSEQKKVIKNVIKSFNEHKRWREEELNEAITGDLDYGKIEWCDVYVGEWEFDSKKIGCDKYGNNKYEKGSYKFETYSIGLINGNIKYEEMSDKFKIDPFIFIINMRGENPDIYSEHNGYRGIGEVMYENEFEPQTYNNEYGYGINEYRYYKQEQVINKMIDDANDW
jgi:hypothetical protein